MVDGVKTVKPATVKTLNQEYEAEIVLVTVPLGVLKERCAQAYCLSAHANPLLYRRIRFEPPLPPWKQQAIDRLGFGNLNKVGLLFSEVFWDDSVDYFGVVPENSDDR